MANVHSLLAIVSTFLGVDLLIRCIRPIIVSIIIFLRLNQLVNHLDVFVQKILLVLFLLFDMNVGVVNATCLAQKILSFWTVCNLDLRLKLDRILQTCILISLAGLESELRLFVKVRSRLVLRAIGRPNVVLIIVASGRVHFVVEQIEHIWDVILTYLWNSIYDLITISSIIIFVMTVSFLVLLI